MTAARILIIEDNPANLELMSYLLRAFGYSVRAAVDGESGIDEALRERPDLLVCDLQLPGLDGYGVAKRLRPEASFAGVPIVAVTAFAMVGDRERVLAAGFDGYVSKPINPESFVAQVEAFLPAERRSGLQAVVASAADAPPADPPPPRPAPQRATVLVVDDSPVNRDLTRSTLEPSGYRVVLAGDRAEALAALGCERPDLILSDVHMPDGNGFELLRAVKADPALRDIPFIFLSATASPAHDPRQALTQGAAAFIPRPIEPQALLARIASCLAAARDGTASTG